MAARRQQQEQISSFQTELCNMCVLCAVFFSRVCSVCGVCRLSRFIVCKSVLHLLIILSLNMRSIFCFIFLLLRNWTTKVCIVQVFFSFFLCSCEELNPGQQMNWILHSLYSVFCFHCCCLEQNKESYYSVCICRWPKNREKEKKNDENKKSNR